LIKLSYLSAWRLTRLKLLIIQKYTG